MILAKIYIKYNIDDKNIIDRSIKQKNINLQKKANEEVEKAE